MPTLKTVTLGCKVNQYETEYVSQGLARAGFRPPEAGEVVDWCFVNTCTVTARSDHKSRKAIRRLARQHPTARLVVMGCYATRAPEEVAALPGVVEVVTDKRRLPELLSRLGLAEPPRGVERFAERHRAYVKVQDGCRMGCSYCIIPHCRPVLQSRPLGDVRDEVCRLAACGWREIVLVGIHLGHWGIGLPSGDYPDSCTGDCPSFRPGDCPSFRPGDCPSFRPGDCPSFRPAKTGLSPSAPSDDGGPRSVVAEDRPGITRYHLADLVESLARLDGDFRLRLSSLEAAEATDRLLGVMAGHPRRICPHLHLSMQSGSDSVLRRMRRPTSHEAYVERCRAAVARLDHPALSTDVIVGFPGETDTEFEATCRAVDEIGFAKVHVFPFSPREGTEAATLPGQVPHQVCQARAAHLARVAARARARFFESLVGRTVQVLIEGASPGRPGWLRGTSARYAPVVLPGGPEQVGRLVDVVVRGVRDGALEASSPVGAEMAAQAPQRTATVHCRGH